MEVWREPRLRKELAVRVRGVDYGGNPFVQDTYTVDISRRGARLEWVSSLKGAGETVELECGRKTARYRVVWIGQIGTPQDNQIGVCSLEPTKQIWDAPLPGPERVPLQPQQALQPQTTAASAAKNQRQRPRYQCRGVVQIWQERAQNAQPGTLGEVSMGGCYIETQWPLPVGTRVEVLLKAQEQEVRAQGLVRYLDSALGMGIVFSEMSGDDREQLRQLVLRLAAARLGAG